MIEINNVALRAMAVGNAITEIKLAREMLLDGQMSISHVSHVGPVWNEALASSFRELEAAEKLVTSTISRLENFRKSM